MTSQVTEMISYSRQLFYKQLIGVDLLLIFTLLTVVPLKAQEQCGIFEATLPCTVTSGLTILELEGNTLCKSVTEGDFVIPVVFHIMYNNPLGPENVSDEQVYQALEDLNMRFAKDEGGTSFNQSIRFELAKFDPAGNCTNGINHVQVDANFSAGIVKDTWGGGSQESAFKNQNYWYNPDHQYMNVWIVYDVRDCDGGQGASYASFPFQFPGNNIVDGVVVRYEMLRRPTFAHEVGHFLGLYHVWGIYSNNSDACLTSPLNCPYGDGVDDTAPVKGTGLGSVCNPGDAYPVTNIMAISGMRMAFTPGQIDRVCHWLSTNRLDLVSNDNLFNTLGTFDFPIEHIAQNTTWSTFRKQNKTVVVSDNAILTITAEVRF
ncbi:MAG: hypothetical protein DRI69_05080, partial [Bacteroidetes bacterium]